MHFIMQLVGSMRSTSPDPHVSSVQIVLHNLHGKQAWETASLKRAEPHKEQGAHRYCGGKRFLLNV